MLLLNDTDLAFMRETELQAMSSTAQIYRPTYTTGALGNTQQSYSLLGTCLCDIWPISRFDREKSSGNQEISKGEFYISVPVGTDVTIEDMLKIDNITYQITFVPLAQSWLTNIRLEARNYNAESEI